jgi:hypothetical protein
MDYNDDNNNNESKKIRISKNYIFDMINNVNNIDTNVNNIDTNVNNEKETKEKSILSSLLLGVNYAYPYENQDENNKILNDINKNLYLQKQNNILIDNKVSNNVKLKIAEEYLLQNTSKYKVNIDKGNLFIDWSFNF